MNDKLLLLREELLQETYTGNVYYWAKPTMNFIKENKIALSPFFTDGDALEKNVNQKSKMYFLSTSRIKFGGYSLSNFNENHIGVIVELDGPTLSQHMSHKPVNYWGDIGKKYVGVNPKETKHRRMVNDENEERFFSDNPYLQPLSKYVKAIYVYCPGFYKKFEERTDKEFEFKRLVEDMASKAGSLGLKFLITDKPNEFKVLRGESLKEADTYGKKYATLVYALKAGKKNPNNPELKGFRKLAVDKARYGESSFSYKDKLKDEERNLHNYFKRNRFKEQELVNELISLMKKSNNRTFEEFINWAIDQLYEVDDE